MSLDEAILTEVKKYILAFWSLFEGLVIRTTIEGFLSNPFIYLIAFYIGFILTWYLIGFKFGKLKGKFSIFSFIGDIFIAVYFGALFSLSGFIAGIILSLLVMDIVKLILPRLGYDYSNLTTKKMIIYFWIIPLVVKILWDRIQYKKLQKEKEALIIQQNEEKIKKLMKVQEKTKLDEEEKFRQIEEVDKVLNDKIENILKKLDKF